jgi:saccharopine dehydrogenase-like NADP-dependent oxidoreductase
MKNILIIGAGKSSASVIRYLLNKSSEENLHITIGDIDLENAKNIVNKHLRTAIILLDINNEEQRTEAIQKADIVVSMLPAHFHYTVAKDCIKYCKHLVTASYISKEMEGLDTKAKEKGLVFMNEIGLDPGIDHMSAMLTIDRIKKMGGKMQSFTSYTGGLIAAESADNLWNYKFTWNPRNVVLAGQGETAKYIENGSYKNIPYLELFRKTTRLQIPEVGSFEAYPNRDSLKYRSIYGLENIPTLYRGTLRKIGFSEAWDTFVQLGMTDDSYTIADSEKMSYRSFLDLFLGGTPFDTVEMKLCAYLKIDQTHVLFKKLTELALFNSNKKTGLKNATPAQMLQKILEDAWTLKKEEKDMIVMQHLFGYELNGEKRQIESNLVVLGKNKTDTAMAKTVGLPVAIAALKIVKGEIKTPGVHRPIAKEIYQPILKELENYGIQFIERDHR